MCNIRSITLETRLKIDNIVLNGKHKRSETKEEHCQTLTQRYQLRKTNTSKETIFQNLLGNPPKITHEPIMRIISKQLVIKLGPVLRKIKNRKAAGLDEIPPEVWKTKQFDDILPRHSNVV